MANRIPEVSPVLDEAGLPLHGFCRFEEIRPYLLSCRAASRIPAAAFSVIIALFPYRFPDDGGPRNLSLYACVPDYHRVAGDVLRRAAGQLARCYPVFVFEPFIDNSPIPEVRAASLSGLGRIGDHGLLIHPRYGSYVFIGSIVTNAPWPVPAGSLSACPHCGACAAACPGHCLSGTSPDKNRCLSSLTQKKGGLTPDEERLIRDNGLLWGCDTCQEACPLNADAICDPHPCFSEYRPLAGRTDLENPDGKAYGWRGREVLRRNWAICRGKNAPD